MANIGTGTVDANGIQRISNNKILFSKFIDVSSSSFSNPDSGYFGYAADGFYREAGVAVALPSTGQPSKATWASEGEHASASATRNTEDAFPSRIFVLLTPLELVILNADTLTVWMRFSRGPSAARTSQWFLGGSDSTIVDADFDNGVLSVVFNDSNAGNQKANLVIADFRSDKMIRLGEETGNTTASGKTILDRNSAVWRAKGLDQIASMTGVVSLSSGNALPGREVYGVSMVTKSNKTYVATATNEGLSMTTFFLTISGLSPASGNFPQLFAKEYSGVNYSTVDDLDGDSTSPTVTASNSSVWTSDGIREGDYFSTGSGGSTLYYRIEKVAPPTLVLSDEAPTSLNVTGGSYRIVRPVGHLNLHTLTSLFYANGEGFVTNQKDQTYQSTRVNIDPWTAPDYTSTVPSSEINDSQIRGSSLYVATDEGVYKVDAEGPSTGLTSSLDYSAASGSGSYKILSDNLATALTVDTESGHLIIASWNGTNSSAIVEVDVDNLHQVVKTTTGGVHTTKVFSLMGYTNPVGPPTVSVS